MKLLLGSSNLDIGNKISEILNCEIIDANITRFADGESRVEINDKINPNESIFIIQSTNKDEYIIEFLLIVDALKRLGSKNIHAIIPYFGYSRQDRRVHIGSPISAKVIANIIQRDILTVTTIDMHFAQLEGFFDIPVYNLLPYDIFIDYIHQNSIQNNSVIVSPDLGGLKKSKEFAKKLGLETVIINKHRSNIGSSEITDVVGNVSGKNCIILDDIVCGGGTLINAAQRLKEMGALSVYALVTHGVFSGQSKEKIEKSSIDKIIVTDSIKNDIKYDKIEFVSVAETIAQKIKTLDDYK
jgi:ribose-phosphate pyrophosphokinase